MYCLNCGNRLNQGEKFCPMCGKAAPQDVNTPNTYPPQQQGYNYPNAYGAQQFAPYGQGIAVKQKSKKPLVITLCCAAAIAIITAAVLLCVNIAHKGTLAGQLEGKWRTEADGTSYDIEFKSDGTIDFSDAVSMIYGSGLNSTYSQFYNEYLNLVEIKYAVDDNKNLVITFASDYYSYNTSDSLAWTDDIDCYSSSSWCLSGDTLNLEGTKFTRVD